MTADQATDIRSTLIAMFEAIEKKKISPSICSNSTIFNAASIAIRQHNSDIFSSAAVIPKLSNISIQGLLLTIPTAPTATIIPINFQEFSYVCHNPY